MLSSPYARTQQDDAPSSSATPTAAVAQNVNAHRSMSVRHLRLAARGGTVGPNTSRRPVAYWPPTVLADQSPSGPQPPTPRRPLVSARPQPGATANFCPAAPQVADASLIVELEDQLTAAPHNHEIRLVLAQHLVDSGCYEAAHPHIRQLAQAAPYADVAQKLDATINAAATATGTESSSDEEEDSGSPPAREDTGAILEDAQALHEAVAQMQKRLAVLRELGAVTSEETQAMTAWVDAFLSAQSAPAAPRITIEDVTRAAQAGNKAGLDQAMAYLQQIVDAVPPDERRADNAPLRDALLTQLDILEAATGSRDVGRDALMHLEHETLGKTYRNATEEISLEDICDIPRDRFMVCEDNTAYDMENLAQWLQDQGNTWVHVATRAPLSAEDTRNVLRHPLGQRLQIQRAANERMVGNVSQQSLTRMQALGTAMLDDQSEDFKPSHAAVDAFLLYLQRLPHSEREALRNMRLSVRDAHSWQYMQGTPQAFISDFQANKICGHKVGQFLRDAASNLLRQL